MEYSRRSLILMTVLCVSGVFADPMWCIDDEFDGEKSFLFNIENGDENVKISKYNESPWEDLEPPDGSNDYAVVFKSKRVIKSRVIRVTEGSEIKFLYLMKKAYKSDEVKITVHDVDDPTIEENHEIKDDSSWIEKKIVWKYNVADIQVSNFQTSIDLNF